MHRKIPKMVREKISCFVTFLFTESCEIIMNEGPSGGEYS